RLGDGRRDEREPAEGRRPGDGHAGPGGRAAHRAAGEGPCEAGRRPPPQGFLNGSPQTSPTGPRPMLTDRVDARNTLAARLVRGSGAAALPGEVVTGGFPS